tara:strand:- start:18791 stop:19126 length:336 start_codon:yes stop_codon:yes gene_type:complete
MGFSDISRKEPTFYPAREEAESVFPNAHTARLSRIFDVQPRTVQKWINGDIETPQDVFDFLDAQQKLLDEGFDFKSLRGWVEIQKQRGVHPEVIAAWVNELYRSLTGENIR